jgi:hypothetical protein
MVELLERLRLDIGVQNQRATPVLTPAHLGESEIKALENSDRIFTFRGEEGQPALTAAEFEELSRCSGESAVVAFLTPHFERIFENLAVVNSEEYTWLQVSSETKRYNQKPDMFVCHGGMYQKREASKTTQETESLRTTDFKFGVLSSWVLRDCISATLEAKTRINKEAFGEVINYGRHLSLDHPEPNDVRIVLFDKTEFWLVVFARGVCALVTKCAWNVGGSLKLLKDFAKASSTWPEVLDSVCGKLDLVVAEGEAFLGHGSFGRVFRVFRREGRRDTRDALALKIVLGVNVVELGAEATSLRGAFALVPDHVMEAKEFVSVKNGAGLLLACVGRPIQKVKFSLAVEALAALHAKGVCHGDPRIANAVWADENVKWIDFRGARFQPSTTTGLFRGLFTDDMTTLVRSFPSVAEFVKVYGTADFSVLQINAELTDCMR